MGKPRLCSEDIVAVEVGSRERPHSAELLAAGEHILSIQTVLVAFEVVFQH